MHANSLASESLCMLCLILIVLQHCIGLMRPNVSAPRQNQPLILAAARTFSTSTSAISKVSILKDNPDKAAQSSRTFSTSAISEVKIVKDNPEKAAQFAPLVVDPRVLALFEDYTYHWDVDKYVN